MAKYLGKNFECPKMIKKFSIKFCLACQHYLILLNVRFVKFLWRKFSLQSISQVSALFFFMDKVQFRIYPLDVSYVYCLWKKFSLESIRQMSALSTVYGESATTASNSSARKRHFVSLPTVALVSFHSRHLTNHRLINHNSIDK